MKKFLFAVIAVLGLAAPAFAQFSVYPQVQATYSQSLAPGLSAGVLGRLGAVVSPNPFSLSLLVRPFIQYDADLVSSGALSVTGFARVRLPLSLAILPATGFGFSVDPAAGLDLTYDLGSGLSALAGVSLDTSLAVTGGGGFSWGINSYLELDYAADPLTLYGGVSLPLAPAFSWSLYAGAIYAVASNITFTGELSTDFSFFDLLLRLSFRI